MVIWYTCNPIKAHMSKGEQKKLPQICIK